MIKKALALYRRLNPASRTVAAINWSRDGTTLRAQCTFCYAIFTARELPAKHSEQCAVNYLATHEWKRAR